MHAGTLNSRGIWMHVQQSGISAAAVMAALAIKVSSSAVHYLCSSLMARIRMLMNLSEPDWHLRLVSAAAAAASAATVAAAAAV